MSSHLSFHILFWLFDAIASYYTSTWRYCVRYSCFIWFGNYFLSKFYEAFSKIYTHMELKIFKEYTHRYVCMYACLHALYILSICVYIYIYKYMFMLAYIHWCMEMSFIMTYKHICLLLLIPFSLHLFPFSCQDHYTSAFMVYTNFRFMTPHKI